MKKSYLSFVITCVMSALFIVLPLVVFAAESYNVDVTFNLTEADLQQPGGTGETEPSGTYWISIPETISFNSSNIPYGFMLSASFHSTDFSDGAHIVISIDGTQTFPDGTFYLFCNGGGSAEKRIACKIYAVTSGDESSRIQLTGPGDAVAARIWPGGRQELGIITLEPTYSPSNIAGAYSGTIHFKVALAWD